ncbi:Uncharacterised protein [uncultured archaeon]|nr:Uncharacterised protein [uncultured archaeon]
MVKDSSHKESLASSTAMGFRSTPKTERFMTILFRIIVSVSRSPFRAIFLFACSSRIILRSSSTTVPRGASGYSCRSEIAQEVISLTAATRKWPLPMAGSTTSNPIRSSMDFISRSRFLDLLERSSSIVLRKMASRRRK